MNKFEQYKKLFADALEVNLDSVEGLKYKDDGWDSVGHMSLISCIEEYFGIEFEPEDIIAFDSFDEGINILGKYGIEISR